MPALIDLTFDTPHGPRTGKLALPEGDGPWPGVVVIHDVFGLQPDTGRHCRNFAAEGYAAFAPDLYQGKVSCMVRTLWAMQAGHGVPFDVVAAAKQALVARGADPHRLGVTGFCMGGGFALVAAADDTYAVAAPFYGNVPRRAERLDGICPTLAQYGARDLPYRMHAARLERHLTELGVPHEVLVHDGVGHSFMNDHEGWLMKLSGYSPPLFAAHDAETERVAWAKLLDFFARHMPA